MEKKNKNIQIVELGIKSFTDALLIQEKYFNEIINIKRSNRKSENKTVTENFMLWVEHTPVITLGKSGKDKNLLLNKNEHKKKKIEYYQTNRGGDITFHGYESGIVYLHMQGACAGCPSSTMTLKMGIENLLKHFIPEVQEVRPIAA